MASSQPLTFAEILRRCRAAAGLTQEQLAERAGLSVRGISDLERGVNRSPRAETVNRLIQALDLPPAQRAWMLAACIPSQAPTQPSRRMSSSALESSPARRALVGRERELIEIGRHLAGEGPPLLVLAGEPGIGKTRLLQEAGARARAMGWTVLSGGCHRRGGQELYAPLLEAMQSHLRGRSRMQVRVETQNCGWLVRLLPELAEINLAPAPSWSLPSEQEQRLVFDAVARFLANVAGPLGTLLVLDDMQWAGEDALDLLATLVRAAPARDVRIIAGYRDTEVGPEDQWSTLLADLAPAGCVTQVRLAPLSSAAASQLLADLLRDVDGVTAHVAARLLRRAGGMPFFLVSCTQALRAGALSGTAAEEIPWDIAQSIRQRVAATPELARELLEVAAVAGRQVRARLLLRVGTQLGHPRTPLGHALKALCGARLLEEDGAGAYRFPHDLVREAVIASLGEARRMTLHEEVAAALESEGAPVPPEVLAHHYAEAGDAARAVVYLERAGDHARAALASAEAEEYYRQLIARLDELGRPAEAGRARVALGALLLNFERYEQARAMLDTAITLLDHAGDLEGVVSAAAHLAEVCASQGATTADLERVLALDARMRTAPPSKGQALLCRGVATLYYTQSRSNEWLASNDRLAKLARAIGDESLLAEALSGQAGYLLRQGHFAEALQLTEEAMALAQRSGDLHTLTYATHNGSLIYQATGDLTLDAVWVHRAHASAAALGKAVPLAHTFSRSGKHWFYAGNWTRARADFAEQHWLAERVGKSWLTSYACLDLGHLNLITGQVTEGQALLEQAIAQAKISSDAQALRQAHLPLAEYELLEGRPAAARDRLLPLLAAPGERPIRVTMFLPLLAWAYLDLGDEAACAATLTACEEQALACGMRPTLASALRIRALGDIRHERWEAATEALRRALELSRQIGYPYLEAQVLFTSGQLQTARREPELARAHFQAALAFLTHLGERLYAEHAERAQASEAAE